MTRKRFNNSTMSSTKPICEALGHHGISIQTRWLKYFTKIPSLVLILLSLVVQFRTSLQAQGEITYLASTRQYNKIPEHLKLTHLVVVTRHGDRAQITRALSPNVPENASITEFWSSQLPLEQTNMRMAASASPYIPSTRANGQESEMKVKLFSGSDSSHSPYAMLTEQGARQLIAVGKELRRRYVGSFLPETIEDAADVLLCRSTNICRTIQSLRSLLAGLYDVHPDGNETSTRHLPYISMRPKSQETMFPHADGPCTAMSDRRNRLFAKYMNSSIMGRWDGLEQSLKQNLGIISDRIGWLTWLNIMEVLVAFDAHNVTLPMGISDADVDKVYDLVGWTWEVMYKDDKLRPLAIGRFVQELTDRLDQTVNGAAAPQSRRAPLPNQRMRKSNSINKAEETKPTKMMIYSGHDSTMVPLLCALGLYNGSWPPYASFLTLEVAIAISSESSPSLSASSLPLTSATNTLLSTMLTSTTTSLTTNLLRGSSSSSNSPSTAASNANRYVRAVYNDEDFVMAGCNGELWCKYDLFLAQMKKTGLTHEEYRAQCDANNTSTNSRSSSSSGGKGGNTAAGGRNRAAGGGANDNGGGGEKKSFWAHLRNKLRFNAERKHQHSQDRSNQDSNSNSNSNSSGSSQYQGAVEGSEGEGDQGTKEGGHRAGKGYHHNSFGESERPKTARLAAAVTDQQDEVATDIIERYEINNSTSHPRHT